jgi:hypothetical protein
MITMTDEMNKFLQELINGGSEELYNCVGENFPEILQVKVGECFRAHPSIKRDLPRSLMRDLPDCDYDKGICSCICNTQSS